MNYNRHDQYVEQIYMIIKIIENINFMKKKEDITLQTVIDGILYHQV